MGGGDLEAQAGLLVDQLVEHRDQQGPAQVVADRDSQGGGWAAGQLGELGEEGLGLGAELEDSGQRRLAGRGQAHAPARPLEKLHVQVALELADLLADRGGGAVVQARRRADRPAARDGQQAQEGGEERRVYH